MFQVTTALPDPSKPVVPNAPLISYQGQVEHEAKLAAEKAAQKAGGGSKKK